MNDNPGIERAAFENYQRDVRFRTIADTCVARAMRDYGSVDPQRADQAAHDIARTATALLLQYVYTDDAELHGLRAERDRYKELALETLATRPGAALVVPDEPERMND